MLEYLIIWNGGSRILVHILAVSVAGAAYLADSCYLVLGEREVCTLEVDMAKHPSPVEQEIAENTDIELIRM